MTREQMAAMILKIDRAKRAGVTKQSLMEYEVFKKKVGDEKAQQLIENAENQNIRKVESFRRGGGVGVTRTHFKGFVDLKKLRKAELSEEISSNPELKRQFIKTPRGSESGFRKDVLELNR